MLHWVYVCCAMLGQCLGGGHGCSFFSSINGDGFILVVVCLPRSINFFSSLDCIGDDPLLPIPAVEFSRFFKTQEQHGGFSELAMRYSCEQAGLQ
jgi:hypothetical protein